MFKGGLADHSEEVTKLHTTTHLLHSALRKVLGEHVQQKGSNITAERLRFDFTHKEKLKESELEKVEKVINNQIKKDLPVTYRTKTFKQAKEEGVLAFFGGKYGEKVKVYTIEDPSAGSGLPFSREVCGGPHVKSTGEIGRVKIKKQEKIGTGLVRIYAEIKEKNN
jgi:alanyl-tRNA synthetase